MGARFWIRRFATIYAGTFIVISAAQLLKGHAVSYALSLGAIWGLISTTIVVSVRLYRSRKGEACAICNDTSVPNKLGGEKI